MLPRKLKIGVKSRISYVFKKGARISAHFFRWSFLPNHLAHHRFSLVVPGRFGKGAVARNLARRRVYEAIRKNLPPVNKTCYDVVVLLSPNAKDAPFGEIEKQVLYLLKRLASTAPRHVP